MSEQFEQGEAATVSGWQAVTVDLAHCVRFYSRLPVPALPWEQNAHALPSFPRLVRVIPFAGLLIGLVPAAVLGCALLLDLGPWLAAILSVGAMVLATGALHEDGLADLADSFGGSTREKRLEIMRDSRIGSFGASALFLALALRIGALATLASRVDGGAVTAVVLLVASLSRTAGLMPLVFLSPARRDGMSQAVGQPARETFWLAAGIAGGIAVVLGALAGLPPIGVALTLVLSGLSGVALTGFASRHLGGQTGDIAGAAQQVAEIAALIGLLTVL
ncbi:adenosylcobinamide-GDP ribazoletransferase [Microvirga tunisiensis]|uniref:Adenosylcobinamide-GDP ribazoletransferase n=1 Tax=Microvirga tunisiensis TaxID=2108360 RepID=A0A5N7MSM6_9HYPH|nr:adenosylcobinamide-GDP ribazoletransferase [Microvirga tunisiensis]MPR12054.1 adenosylcobinamide-GDP ribazoletransferase [Microvirga tunisiensis]MPR29995.1 adenosylcobinamide-GDP ribazoletransferase [Microvirga tunisiensis]